MIDTSTRRHETTIFRREFDANIARTVSVEYIASDLVRRHPTLLSAEYTCRRQMQNAADLCNEFRQHFRVVHGVV